MNKVLEPCTLGKDITTKQYPQLIWTAALFGIFSHIFWRAHMLRHRCRGQETTAKRQFLPLLCGFLSTLNPSFLQAHWWTFQNKYGVYASITMHAGESTCGINLVELLGSSDACLPRAGWCCYWILEANDAPGNQSKFDHVSEDMISEFFSILSILLKAPCFHSPLGWPKAATYSVKRGDGKRACVPSHTECHLAQ